MPDVPVPGAKGVSAIPVRGAFVGAVSREAAVWAVKAYHYSRCVPAGKSLVVGCWEDGRFIGCIVYSRGAASNIHKPFGVAQDAICELTRVALGPHTAPTSRFLALSVRYLRKTNPGLRVVVSYADPEQQHGGHRHHGGVYQAAGWTFIGQTGSEASVLLHGKVTHGRTVVSKHGTRSIGWLRTHVDPAAESVVTLPKFRYALGLDAAMRAQLAARSLPYPKPDRATEAQVSGAPRSDQGDPLLLGHTIRRGGDPAKGSGRSIHHEVTHA